jgi:hypothetical protein
MPDVEMWTFSPLPASGKRIRQLGINFGAPGDRRSDDGTLWLEYPSVGGPSPDVPLEVAGEGVEFFREHSSLTNGPEPRWIFASGVRGARSIRVRLANREDAGPGAHPYRIRLYFRGGPELGDPPTRHGIRLQGQPHHGRRVRLDSDDAHGTLNVWECDDVPVEEFLEIEFDSTVGATGGPEIPAVCGLELILQQ